MRKYLYEVMSGPYSIGEVYTSKRTAYAARDTLNAGTRRKGYWVKCIANPSWSASRDPWQVAA